MPPYVPLALEQVCGERVSPRWSESTSQRNDSGCVPLHEVLTVEDAPLEVLRIVHCAYPDASRVKDKNGRCPLYYIRQATPLAFVEQLIMSWPQAAQERDDDGQLPLHVALEARVFLEVLSYLLASYPSVTMTEG